MDIESFNQCLGYLQASLQGKGTLDKALPILGTLVGAVFGFALNYFAGRGKENNAAKNKLMCIEEDVMAIEHSLDELNKEALRMISLIVKKTPARGNYLPLSISALCLESYFIDVAHKYSRQQRYWIQLLISRLEEISDALVEIKDFKGPMYTRAVNLLNLIGLAVNCSRFCKMIMQGEILEDEGVVSWLRVMNVSEEHLDAYSRAFENAEVHNTTLEL